MKWRMWTYDLAREQCPQPEHWMQLCRHSLDHGYNALGIYMEHRFAYPSAPWAAGRFALEPETVKWLEKEFPDLTLVPFVNLLGHMEGFLNTQPGRKFAEEKFKGMQACACNPEFVTFSEDLLKGTLDCFSSPLIHIGGDETAQLAACPKCKKRAEELGGDGKARLYGEHFGRLAQEVINAGRQPAVWGDMLLQHPEALDFIPKEALIFDWQYFDDPRPSAKKLAETHKVVLCPTLHVYNAAWCHLRQSESNLTHHVEAATELQAEGVCLTTWEGALMANYQTLLPAIGAAGNTISGQRTPLLDGYRDDEREWARLMGEELAECGPPFAFSNIRSGLKCRLLLYSNPFLAWLRHGEQLCGEAGTRAGEIATKATHMAPGASMRGVAQFVVKAIEFVRLAEQAHQAWSQDLPGVAAACLAPARQAFEDLEKVAKATHLNAGGSLADIERCRVARGHVETVIRRIKEYGSGSLGYQVSFEQLTHPKFMPHDQGAWWLINTFANE